MPQHHSCHTGKETAPVLKSLYLIFKSEAEITLFHHRTVVRRSWFLCPIAPPAHSILFESDSACLTEQLRLLFSNGCSLSTGPIKTRGLDKDISKLSVEITEQHEEQNKRNFKCWYWRKNQNNHKNILLTFQWCFSEFFHLFPWSV